MFSNVSNIISTSHPIFKYQILCVLCYTNYKIIFVIKRRRSENYFFSRSDSIILPIDTAFAPVPWPFFPALEIFLCCRWGDKDDRPALLLFQFDLDGLCCSRRSRSPPDLLPPDLDVAAVYEGFVDLGRGGDNRRFLGGLADDLRFGLLEWEFGGVTAFLSDEVDLLEPCLEPKKVRTI